MQETNGIWKKREDAQAMIYSATFDDIMLRKGIHPYTAP